ncbi:MAG: FtsQ-type POTRA domain-containing protein [Nitrospiraceae bacterium]|nr:MAG: FtsQ-type POTRA domain-containing protein [Nitrospiraceae bacterium]
MRNNRRINKQGAAPKAKKRRCLLKLFALVLLITGAYWGAKYAVDTARRTMFPVKEIVFSGNKHISDSELKAIMGINGNESLLGLSSGELEARLLKSPWIKAVSFRKDFPHKFTVRIEESMPYALLEMNGRTFFVDDKGNMLEELKGESIPFLPVISGDPFKNASVFPDVLSLVRTMKDKGFTALKDRIEIIIPHGAKPEDISMQVDGMLVKVGHGEYDEKLQRLLELEDEIMRRGIPVDYIDLRFANKVIVKPINEVIR